MQIAFLEDPLFVLISFILAAGRVYMEIMGARPERLPLSQAVLGERASNFHKTGLYISIGYIVLFAPQVLFFS